MKRIGNKGRVKITLDITTSRNTNNAVAYPIVNARILKVELMYNACSPENFLNTAALRTVRTEYEISTKILAYK